MQMMLQYYKKIKSRKMSAFDDICPNVPFCREKEEKKNQSPTGLIWSAVPLPCYYNVVKSQNVAGQWPKQETKSCIMEKYSFCLSIHPPLTF